MCRVGAGDRDRVGGRPLSREGAVMQGGREGKESSLYKDP